jgi:hypothetical protein
MSHRGAPDHINVTSSWLPWPRRGKLIAATSDQGMRMGAAEVGAITAEPDGLTG